MRIPSGVFYTPRGGVLPTLVLFLPLGWFGIFFEVDVKLILGVFCVMFMTCFIALYRWIVWLVKRVLSKTVLG